MNEQSMKEITKQMKADSFRMAALSKEERNRILSAVGEALVANKDAIFAANRQDMENAEAGDIPAPVKKRLRFDEHKLTDVCDGIKQLIALPDPIGKEVLARELDEGLILKRVTCPIGVIGIIFES